MASKDGCSFAQLLKHSCLTARCEPSGIQYSSRVNFNAFLYLTYLSTSVPRQPHAVDHFEVKVMQQMPKLVPGPKSWSEVLVKTLGCFTPGAMCQRLIRNDISKRDKYVQPSPHSLPSCQVDFAMEAYGKQPFIKRSHSKRFM